jgi:8-amino-7-oxononanoate synthase
MAGRRASGVPPHAAVIEERLAELRIRDRLRTLVPLRDAVGTEATLDGQQVTVFCSNDYLGLRQHPRLVAAGQAALGELGAGSGSSRLVAGTLPCHERLERTLADAFGADTALVFSSGYQANLALLTTLGRQGDLLCSDELNHASIVDACRLSRADTRVFAHGDVDGLTDQLRVVRQGHRWVVVEGLYSMDGDRVDLAGYDRATRAAGATLVVDEAHAFGTLGPGGRGACAEAGIDAPIRLGTLGKALGSHGAFVLCDADVRDLLVSSGRAFLYTTALPPASAAAATEALAVIHEEPWRREELSRQSRRIWQGIRDLGLGTSTEPSPILPVVVGEEAKALALAEYLLQAGLFCRAIRPPTVPEHTCRLRLTVSAQHSDAQIDHLLDALAAGVAHLGLDVDPC